MTLWQGLRKAVEAEGAEDVRVAQRGEETYLVRAGSEEGIGSVGSGDSEG